MNQARRGVIPLNMQRINLQRPSFLLPFLLAFLARADFAAEKTRLDLQQLKAPPGFHISVFAENIVPYPPRQCTRRAVILARTDIKTAWTVFLPGAEKKESLKK